MVELGDGGLAPRRRMHNHVSYNISKLTMYGIKLNNSTTFMVFNFVLTVKPCTKINWGMHLQHCQGS